MKYLLLLTLALSGCATCQQHPTACAIAGAVVVGSVAYTLEMHSDRHEHIGIKPNYGVCDPHAYPECH